MNQELDNYSSTTPIDDELQGRFKVLRIVAFMRWVTLLAGPGAILIDDYIQPWLLNQGLPSIITMEDLSKYLFLDVLGISRYIDEEQFLAYYHHLNIISCFLFVVFVGWVIIAKKKAVIAARDLALMEEKMRGNI
ncbi:MAG TPA: hypothetical protein EYM81_02205 [Candidatus Poseidoniales archaeon]|nr:MAG: hypothetical protein CXX81_29085 [Euryarchaeota archaeon]HIB24301.1 hypothetical protein [Candidatus Poseidoniales archaeon]PXY76104.1 MAG: hypothetical protein CXX81_16175 [Euryarchaeota archaeon]PXY79302.1 MAG: hypothetical protein CXX81_03075 [Euryarchaeota archaeon]HIB42095.1 hypothetical protein [Candidatus Poseidoniales archaeon]